MDGSCHRHNGLQKTYHFHIVYKFYYNIESFLNFNNCVANYLSKLIMKYILCKLRHYHTLGSQWSPRLVVCLLLFPGTTLNFKLKAGEVRGSKVTVHYRVERTGIKGHA